MGDAWMEVSDEEIKAERSKGHYYRVSLRSPSKICRGVSDVNLIFILAEHLRMAVLYPIATGMSGWYVALGQQERNDHPRRPTFSTEP